MTDLVSPTEIEKIVGVERHPTDHYARAISAEQTVYILHSHACKDTTPDLRDCPFSLALEDGIDLDTWVWCEDRPVIVAVSHGWLVPAERGAGE